MNNKPPTAGNNASTKGAECRGEGSWSKSSDPLALGKRMSSVEDRIELRASETESEKREGRRRFGGVEVSEKVAARPRGR